MSEWDWTAFFVILAIGVSAMAILGLATAFI